MTSIKDIPIEDVILFMRGNNRVVPDDDEAAYSEARNLMKVPKLLFYPPAIAEWVLAYNFINSKKKIRSYSEDEILNMHQNEVDNLAKILGMRGNNRYNVMGILNYMGKIA